MSDMVFYYAPEPARPLLEEGVTTAWLVKWTGEPGPARRREVAALVDGEGNVSVEPVGDWVDCDVVDDQEQP